MTLFGALGTSGSGLTVYRKWMDAISDNLANLNTVQPTDEAAFQARYVVAREAQLADGSGGVEVGGIELGDPTGRLVHEPDHPLADGEGMVRYPDIDMAAQMTQLIMAQRGYQANLSVVDRAKAAYEAALSLGRS